MNKFFVAIRLLGYVTIFCFYFIYSHAALSVGKWIITIIVISWGTWDLWKKPDELVRRMRTGVWIEMFSISLWVVLLNGYILLFAFISPLIRTSMHLRLLDRIFIFVITVAEVILFRWCVPGTNIWVPIMVFMILLLYGSIINGFLHEREKSRRLIALSGFEREQMVRDQERVRMSQRLHDTMGQYWMAVIRAMDVAAAIDGSEKDTYIMKAREAAEQGLNEMRRAVHQWNEGKQTPDQWFKWTIDSLERLREITQIDIQYQSVKINWTHFHRPVEISEFISRFIVESVTNAIRHGLATKIYIFSQIEASKLSLTVRDNGKGFSLVEGSVQNGIGISSIRQMAKNIDAQLQMESTTNYGTTIHISIPYQR
ncbi:ATP-binding protein [Bacillus sp. FJAT-49736]|uniref:sensor histidine kinase n=1 Tax=Bacillus sp. FJAT-49736 TaxID=2833582 RepID=UPI001BC9AF0B|nr:ATP-binding protein [Bacillus sp. FJAT-49736]MBS4174956.1 hypothetical protein [Bacillus sp. FJAT-49736]